NLFQDHKPITPMKIKLIIFLILTSFFILDSYADSATWSTNPVSGDWNDPLNWTPNTVPNGPLDTATFDVSNITDISLSDAVEVEGIVFNGASPFTITCTNEL